MTILSLIQARLISKIEYSVSRFPCCTDSNKFVIILPHTDETGAYYEAERIRSAIVQTSFFDQNFYEIKKLSPKRKQEYQKITVSAGIIDLDLKTVKKVQEALSLAEKALEFAKANGRNQAIRYSKLVKN